MLFHNKIGRRSHQAGFKGTKEYIASSAQGLHMGHNKAASEDAYLFDEENGNTKWANVIQKELFELKLYDSFFEF